VAFQRLPSILTSQSPGGRGLSGLASILGHHQEAIALFRRGIERNPLSVAGYNNLGQGLSAGEQFKEAEGALLPRVQGPEAAWR